MAVERKQFRKLMQFSSEEKTKRYFKFTDEIPIDWERLKACTARVKDIFALINPIIYFGVQVDIDEFNGKIDNVFNEMRKNGLFQKLTNNGRNPVDVYYNWLRGYAVCEFFIKSIADIFQVPTDNIKRIGKDDFTNIEVFKRTSDADFEIMINEALIFKLEVQSGFTGVNDIKKTKIDRAKNVKENENIDSYLIHFDIFNGQVALYLTSNMNVNEGDWKLKFENSKTIPIPNDAFKWKLEDKPLKYSNLVYNKETAD